MVDDLDVLPRQGFSQMARNMRCQLYFPHPTDQVVLLRTGVLHHINTYMQALGLAPSSDPLSAPKQALTNGLPDQANADSAGHQHVADTMAVSAVQAHQPDNAADGLDAPELAADDAVACAQRDSTAAATVAHAKGLSTSAAPGTGLQNGSAPGLKVDLPLGSPDAVDGHAVQGNNASQVLGSWAPACAVNKPATAFQLVTKPPWTVPGWSWLMCC